MALPQELLNVLEFYFKNRHSDGILPNAQDIEGNFGPEEIAQFSSRLAEQGLISWSAQTGGKLSFKGLIACVEPRYTASEATPHTFAGPPQGGTPTETVPAEEVFTSDAFVSDAPMVEIDEEVATSDGAVGSDRSDSSTTTSAPSPNTAFYPEPVQAGSFYERRTPSFSPQRKQPTKHKTTHGTKHQTTRSTRARQTSRSRREDGRRPVPSRQR